MKKNRLILASSSIFRKQLLEKLHITFQQVSPDIDESTLKDEAIEALVQRLARQKAQALATQFPQQLIIGSDELAVVDQQIFGKPLNHANAVRQLQQASGKTMRFYTGLCLYNSETKRTQLDYECCSVKFRQLSDSMIENYLQKEQPYHSAGSIKAEGLAIALFESMHVPDANALMGLPLIKLVDMLSNEGVNILS